MVYYCPVCHSYLLNDYCMTCNTNCILPPKKDETNPYDIDVLKNVFGDFNDNNRGQ